MPKHEPQAAPPTYGESRRQTKVLLGQLVVGGKPGIHGAHARQADFYPAIKRAGAALHALCSEAGIKERALDAEVNLLGF